MRLSIAREFVRHARASGGAASKEFVRHARVIGGAYSEKQRCDYELQLKKLHFCYKKMNLKNYTDAIVITKEDFEELKLRFPRRHRDTILWDQITKKKVVVKDEFHIYPNDWMNWIGNANITHLAQPIQVIIPTKADIGRTKVYVDAYFEPREEIAGGGVVVLDGADTVDTYCVAVPAKNAFHAQVAVLHLAAQFAMGTIVGPIEFVTDCLDVVDVLKEHSFIELGEEPVYWELQKALSELDWSIQHIPREGNSLADAIARRMLAHSVMEGLPICRRVIQKVDKTLVFPDEEDMIMMLLEEWPILRIKLADGPPRFTPR